MTSLRARLLLILIASTSAIWLCGFCWIALSSRHAIHHLLDRRLEEAARMVLSLTGAAKGSPGGGLSMNMASNAAEMGDAYEHRLNCQVWSFDGHLIGRSGNAPLAKLTENASGFSEKVIDGQTFRVYAMEDKSRGVRVLVGDYSGQRHEFILELLSSLLLPAAISLPLLAILIWASVHRGLRPLQRVTEVLDARDAETLVPLDVGRAPSEIRPLISAMNRLFEKVVAAREHERSFVAYAAHEMRTPLAGLKTQVQIAVKTTDTSTRNAALAQTLQSVDRTTRLVRQLLAMSLLDAGSASYPNHWMGLESALADVTANIGHELAPGRVLIEPSVRGRSIAINRELFDLAVRNLIENALQLSPPDGTVRLLLLQEGGEACVCVEDDGPGIPPEERELVRQRFFRGRHKSKTGSGLGLAIVTAALDRAGASLRLSNIAEGRGLRAEIVLSFDRLRFDQAA